MSYPPPLVEQHETRPTNFAGNPETRAAGFAWDVSKKVESLPWVSANFGDRAYNMSLGKRMNTKNGYCDAGSEYQFDSNGK